MIPRYTNRKIGKIFSSDSRFHYWLKVELAVCEVWHRHGLFDRSILDHILKHAKFDYQAVLENEKVVHHDVIAFLMNVREHLGTRGADFIHYGLTSSDVVDTALALQVKDALILLHKRMDVLLAQLREKAIVYKQQLMIGRTHGIHAEVTTLGLKFAHFYAEFTRQRSRLIEADKIISVGKISGAVGNYSVISPQFEIEVCEKLGLTVDPISTQVISRDRLAELLCSLALLAGSLDRLAQEIRLLQKTESRELEEPFASKQRGSSAMPHKRNPVICERICGLARIIQANTQVGFRNMALWHERDISHSSNERIVVPDSLILMDYMLDKMSDVLVGLKVYPENMEKTIAITRGLIYSQHIMLYLVSQGMNKDEAYECVQKIAIQVWNNEQVHFREQLAKNKTLKPLLTEQVLDQLFDAKNYVKHIDSIYQRLGLEA